MVFTLLALLITSIIRAVVTSQYDVSPFVGAHILFLIPDFMFLGLMVYWFLFHEKRTITPSVALFFLAYVGSIVWDYQSGFYWLKFLVFPGLFYAILHPQQYNDSSIRRTIALSFPILHAPFTSIRQFSAELFYRTRPAVVSDVADSTDKKEESNDVVSFSLSKAIWFGIALGLVILIALASLDPDFASFLQLTKWWDVIFDSFSSFIYYLFIFFWYFWKPVRTTWEPQEYLTTLNSLLHRAVVMIVGIFVGYTFYDAYIVMRAFRMIKLTFETVGRNTQMNFLELVILGGGWLFLVAFLLNKLKDKMEKNQSTVSTIFTLLVISCIWLIPPVLNILRVLLNVYIPMFGLTARRLFGIYTTIAFSLTFIYVLWGGFKRDTQLFTRAVVTFFLTVVMLSFVLPTNLFIANWHFSRYLNKDTKADYNYFKKLKLEKWGWLFQNELNPEESPSDAIWGLTLSERMKDEEMQKQYKEFIKTKSESELQEIIGLLESNNVNEFVKTYGGKRSSDEARLRARNFDVQSDAQTIMVGLNNDLNDSSSITNRMYYYPVGFNVSYEKGVTVPPFPSTGILRRPSGTPSPTPYPPSYITSTEYIQFKFAEHRSEKTLLRTYLEDYAVLPF